MNVDVLVPVAEKDLHHLPRIRSQYPSSRLLVSYETPLAKARRRLIDQAQTPFCLCLDADNLLPDGYVAQAIRELRRNPLNAAAALLYEYPWNHGHLGFGTSVWKTPVLKALYDWDGTAECECVHMWKRVDSQNYRIVTLPLTAVHLKKRRR